MSKYGEISRTATGDAPLQRIGCPVAPAPQPVMLMTVVLTLPVAGVAVPAGFRNSWTNPTSTTGLGSVAPPLLSNTGTVTSDSLTITSFPARPEIGLSVPATNSKGAPGGPEKT